MKRATWGVLPVAAMLAGCASNPEQSIYVMQAATGVTASPQTASGDLALRLRPVMLPDYLDTTDLMTRIGQYKTEASRTGRWGERLSQGVTRSLAADLGHRLSADVATDGPTSPASVQLDVSISAFDVTAATSVLAASWTLTWPGDARPPLTHHGTFTTPVAPPGGDAPVVAAMAETVAELADGIAATVRADAPDNGRLALRHTDR